MGYGRMPRHICRGPSCWTSVGCWPRRIPEARAQEVSERLRRPAYRRWGIRSRLFRRPCGKPPAGRWGCPMATAAENGLRSIPIGTRATGKRTESDSLGQIEVPAEHYWGAQTQRSLIHFSIGEDRMPKAVHRDAYGYVKKAAALVNGAAGRLDPKAHRRDRRGRGRGDRRRNSTASSRCTSGRPGRGRSRT